MLISKRQIKFFTITLFLMLSFTLNGWSLITYEFKDTWKDWPGTEYITSIGDELGTPKLDKIKVVLDDTQSFLQQIQIVLHDSKTVQNFNSLFINNSYTNPNNWDQWNYFVHDGGASNSSSSTTSGTVPTDGLYSVNDQYKYTTVAATRNRFKNPNGIDNGSLSLLDSSFGPSIIDNGWTINYDFSNLINPINIDGGFFVAYAPWCANDVMGGGATTVPEPATMVIFGLSMLGIIGLRKKA